MAPVRLAAIVESSGDSGADLIFTAAELESCAHRVDRAQALGARFAAKEALFKALGTGWTDGVSFLDAEVVSAAGGRPTMRLWRAVSERAAAMGVERIHLSLSHDAGVAAAVVVLEGDLKHSVG